MLYFFLEKKKTYYGGQIVRHFLVFFSLAVRCSRGVLGRSHQQWRQHHFGTMSVSCLHALLLVLLVVFPVPLVLNLGLGQEHSPAMLVGWTPNLWPDCVALAYEALTLIKTSTRACWFVSLKALVNMFLPHFCCTPDYPWPRLPIALVTSACLCRDWAACSEIVEDNATMLLGR